MLIGTSQKLSTLTGGGIEMMSENTITKDASCSVTSALRNFIFPDLSRMLMCSKPGRLMKNEPDHEHSGTDVNNSKSV